MTIAEIEASLKIKYALYDSKYCLGNADDREFKGRLNAEQQQILELEYQKQQNWGTEKIKELANRLNLGRTKVYKWNWDRRKKEASQDQRREKRKYEVKVAEIDKYMDESADYGIP